MLEWITDGKVEAERVLERRHIVVSLFRGFIRIVYAYSKVGTHHYEAGIVAQSGTGAERKVG